MRSWNEKGVTLVEVVITIGLFAITVAAFSMMMSYQNRVSRFVRVQSSRDVTVTTLRNLLGSPGVLYWAAVAPGSPNAQFAKCVLGDPASSCEKGKDYPLKVFFPNSSKVATGSALPSAAPVFYDNLNAEPCDASNPESADPASVEGCPLAVTTFFRAHCPRDTDNCKQAQFVQIVVDIRNRAKTGGVKGEAAGLVAIRSLHEEIIVDTAQVALFKSQDEFDPAANKGCAAGEVSLGVDGLGNIFCQKVDFSCPPGFYTVGVDRYFRPISDLNTRMGEFTASQTVRCQPLDCGDNVMLSMFNSNGQLQPECLAGPRTCPTSEAAVLTSVEPDGRPVCAYLDSCIGVNRSGTDYSKQNFTRGFQLYNGNFIDMGGAQIGVVKSWCEAYGCGLGKYMRRVFEDGQCRPTP